MAQDPNESKTEPRAVLVLTNKNAIVDKEGKTLRQTGWYLPEVAHPYFTFADAGYKITFASINGGECEADFGSYEEYAVKKEDAECVKFVELMRASDPNEKDVESDKAAEGVKGVIGRDETGNEKDRTINKLILVTTPITGLQGKASEFDIIFFCGGHGTCYDFYDSNEKHDKPSKKDTRDMHSFAAAIYENKDKPGVVAAVCHGPLALVDLALSDGTLLVKDKQVTGFTNSEEEAAKLKDVVPLLLEDGLKNNGAKFVGKDNWACNAVADSGVVTGQNPQSAKEAAKLCLEQIKERRK